MDKPNKEKRSDASMDDHEHGKMDITEQERTFEGFIKFWIWLFGISAGVLVFLAIFNT